MVVRRRKVMRKVVGRMGDGDWVDNGVEVWVGVGVGNVEVGKRKVDVVV